MGILDYAVLGEFHRFPVTGRVPGYRSGSWSELVESGMGTGPECALTNIRPRADLLTLLLRDSFYASSEWSCPAIFVTSLTRPPSRLSCQSEFRAIASYSVWHDAKRDITDPKEHATSGWDREAMRECWEWLDKTSRSFSMVIKELDGDLARVVS
jgi:hypothetical protein